MNSSSDKVIIEEGAIVCEDSVIKGHVKISKGCIVHPKATIISENGGSIIIGKNCLIEERATIINKNKNDMEIGCNNAFEVHSVIDSVNIGSNNVFEVYSFVGGQCIIKDNCVIGVKCHLMSTDICFDNVCVYGSDLQVRKKIESIIPTLALEMEKLREILPSFHKLRNPNA